MPFQVLGWSGLFRAVILLWLSGLVGLAPRPAGGEPVAGARPKAVLAIALEDVHFSPYHFRSQDGHWIGVNVDLVRAVAAELGYQVQIEAYPWARVVENFQQGRGSGVMDLLRKPERERFLAYVEEPLAHEVTQLFVPAASDVVYDGHLDSLGGRDVGVVRGYFYGGEFEAVPAVGKVVFSSQGLLVRNVALGRVALGIGTRAAIQSEANALGVAERIRFLDPPINRIPNHLAFVRVPGSGSGGEDLARRFSAALREFKRGAAWPELLVRYGINPDQW
ncbi:MAG: transporter substrate-binding domain-containing protein [Magnetococcales bacterium]|nr:transporter substrate-binding domain-containing protein [Magnetococcales bacterium]